MTEKSLLEKIQSNKE